MAKRRKIGKRVEKARAAMKKRRERRANLFSIGKDILVAVIIVVVVMGTLYAYSGGIWPPMVVVESESMMHGDDSEIGVIDTGDLTVVKKIGGRNDVVTYVEGNPSYTVQWRTDFRNGSFDQPPAEKFGGKKSPLSKYGDYGEVIIYKKNGLEGTPVIHRAIVWIEPNTTTECLDKLPHGYVAGGDFPDIRNSNHKGLRCVTQIVLKDVGYKKDDIQIDVRIIMNNAVAVHGEPFAGFLTKGDHNRNTAGASFVDQQTHSDNRGRKLAPIKAKWVVGKAKGELPWFGSLKLVLSKTRKAEDIPPSSWRGLIITIILIIVIPFIIDMLMGYYAKRKKKEDKEAEEDIEKEEKKRKRKGRGRRKKKRKGKKARNEDLDEEEEEEEEEGEDLGEEEDDLFEEFEDDFEEMAESRSRSKKKGRRRR